MLLSILIFVGAVLASGVTAIAVAFGGSVIIDGISRVFDPSASDDEFMRIVTALASFAGLIGGVMGLLFGHFDFTLVKYAAMGSLSGLLLMGCFIIWMLIFD